MRTILGSLDKFLSDLQSLNRTNIVQRSAEENGARQQNESAHNNII